MIANLIFTALDGVLTLIFDLMPTLVSGTVSLDWMEHYVPVLFNLQRLFRYAVLVAQVELSQRAYNLARYIFENNFLT